jgi:ribonucleoside-triphosphate reductase
MLQITKRDGSSVNFEKDKIISAINKAFIEVDGTLYETDTAKDIADDIYDYAIMHKKQISVEDIQDMIEEYLMHSERKDVAKAYIRYRYKKEVARNHRSDFIDAIGEKLSASNVQNQNANVDEYSFGGRIGEASSIMTKDYALNYIVSEKARKNHLENRIYIHDLDSYAVGMPNCLSVPFDDLLAKGFNTRQTDVRPANSVNTAF